MINLIYQVLQAIDLLFGEKPPSFSVPVARLAGYTFLEPAKERTAADTQQTIDLAPRGWGDF